MRWLVGIWLAVGTVWGATAPAAASGDTVIPVRAVISGIPSTVPAHSRVQFTLTVTQQSPYRLDVSAFDFQLWNTCGCNPDQTAGLSATWLDPTDGTWHVEPYDGGDSFLLHLAHSQIVKPGQPIRAEVRLDLRNFRNGRYIIMAAGTGIGNAFDAEGRNVPYTGIAQTAPQVRFSIGVPTVGGGGTRTTPTPRATPKPTPATTAKPATHPATTPTGAASSPMPPTSAPSGTSSYAPATRATYAMPPSRQAAPSTSAYVGGTATVLVIAGAVGVFWRRRRRHQTPDQAE